MTPIEIMALVLIAFSAVKILVVLISPKSWADLVKKIWANPMLVSLISLILAALVLYYLVWVEGVTIVQIFAVMLFVALLAAVGIGIYANEVISIATKILKKGILKKAWLYIIIWIALIVWGAYEIFT